MSSKSITNVQKMDRVGSLLAEAARLAREVRDTYPSDLREDAENPTREDALVSLHYEMDTLYGVLGYLCGEWPYEQVGRRLEESGLYTVSSSISAILEVERGAAG